MNILCYLGVHSWRGCSCTYCDEVRDHVWDIDKCSVCGAACTTAPGLQESKLVRDHLKSAEPLASVLAQKQLSDYLGNPGARRFMSTYSLRWQFSELSATKQNFNLVKQFLFFDDVNLLMGAFEALQSMGLGLAELQNIYVTELTNPKRRSISLWALKHLKWVPPDIRQRIVLHLNDGEIAKVEALLPEALDILVNILKEETDSAVIDRALKILVNNGDASMLAELVDIFKKHPRTEIVSFFSKYGYTDASDALVEAIGRGGYHTDLAIFESLVQFKDRRVVPFLLDFLTENSVHWMQKAAVDQLVMIGDTDIVRDLITLYIECRSSQIGDAFHRFGERAVVPLVSALEHADEAVHKMARSQLELLQWKPATDDETRLFERKPILRLALSRLSDRSSEVRLAAISDAAQIKDIAAVPFLVPLLRDVEYSIRRRACETLQQFAWVPERDDDRLAFYTLSKNWEELFTLGESSLSALDQFMVQPYCSSDDVIAICTVFPKLSAPPEAIKPFLARMVWRGSGRSWALNELSRLGDFACDEWIQLLKYDGFNKYDVVDRAVTELSRFDSDFATRGLLDAIPVLERTLALKIAKRLGTSCVAHRNVSIRTTLNTTFEHLFEMLARGEDCILILETLGAEPDKIADCCLSLLTRLKRPTRYTFLLEYLKSRKSARVAQSLVELVKTPDLGEGGFYKEMVRTIGAIGDKSTIPLLEDLLDAHWKVLDSGSGTTVVNSEWIAPQLKEAIVAIRARGA